ncbi:tetratricopeptide repeat protein [Thalassoglobus polymorphus]|nr:hypothetical protein [Thalassoglobus polymorphus]
MGPLSHSCKATFLLFALQNDRESVKVLQTRGVIQHTAGEMMSDELDQIEQQLEELDKKSEECFQKCQIRSAVRIAKEATRLAKTHGLAVHYMRGLFDQMRFGHGLLDPQATREASVELVLLLENEEQARRIQPNLDEGHYQWLCSWMSTCAYDNLAEATGMMSGFNSEGMHECINEGLQVCRQTGKMECVKCFREYAADVYFAADDLEMVRHQCESLLEYRKDGSDNKDRRWSGHHKLGKLLILEGRLELAIQELNKAFELSVAEDVYLKTRSKLLVAATLDEALMLAGKPRFDWGSVASEFPEEGEWLYIELRRSMCDALENVLSGNFDQAIETLTEWDRRLTEQNCHKDWFEVRLRLIAAYLLSNNQKRAEALTKGLEASASEAQDFLTLRRLEQLFNEETATSPVAALQESGNAAVDSSSQAGEESTSDNAESGDDSDDAEAETPLGNILAEIMQRLMLAPEDETVREQVLEEFLSYTPSRIEDPRDGAYLVHLSQFVVQGTEDATRVWPWALQILEAFFDDPVTVSVVAAIGNYFRQADPGAFESITVEQLEAWFKRSTSPKVTHAKNFSRAGDFYLDEGNLGEAERCYSRGFRLKRTEPTVVLPLADVYRQSDRPRDALAVLDLSLREGADDQSIAWEAAMTALQIEQFDSVLTYMDKFFALGEPQTWAHYYRGVALMQLGRHEESLLAIDAENEFDPPGTFHLSAIKLCNLIALGQDQEQIDSIFTEVLDEQLSEIDYLSLNGLVRLFGHIWEHSKHLPANHLLRTKLEHQLLVAGFLPDTYFDGLREQIEETKTVNFFNVQIRQPLNEAWKDSRGCLYGQDEWTEYQREWGVLAESEEAATNFVLAFQSRCEELPAEIVDVHTDEVDYIDRPGVVWQGMHWTTDDLAGNESDDESDDELFGA